MAETIKWPEAGYTPANLRALLAHKGWTQAHAAKLLGVTLSTLQRWLIDDNKPSRRDMPLSQWQALLRIAELEPSQ